MPVRRNTSTFHSGGPRERVPDRVTGPWGHEPVLLEEALATWVSDPRGTFVDGTVGAGGHAEALLDRHPEARLVGLDRDPAALRTAAARLERFGDRARLARGDYGDMETILGGLGVTRPAGILLDLGVSSLQLDDPGRGFSHAVSGPLRMTLDIEARHGAAEFVAAAEEGELARIFREFGELPRPGRAARAVVEARDAGRLTTTEDLVVALRRAGVSGPRRLSQAFQALRFALNHELDSLDRGLDAAPRLLPPGGTLTVISFESLMDRRVKHAFRPPREGRPVPGVPEPLPRWRVLTRRVVRPGPEEIARNPRARSARLRAAERTAHA
jgi:16S rRNA (cytosine1402-N4)-methyltransferase